MLKKLHAVCFLLVICLQLSAQAFDINVFNAEKEEILNTIINSAQFDSVYTSKRVYFCESELLSKATSIILKRKNCKVRIKSREELKGKSYIVLGDFTMARINPQNVRVQLSIMPTKILLNLRLEKKNDKWLIVNHLTMYE